MNAMAGWLRARLASRPDSEHGQAAVRMGALAVVLVFLVAGGGRQSEAWDDVLGMVALGFVIGSVILAWILVDPRRSHPRRLLGMAADYGLMAAAMIRMGEPIAWVYVLIMWVTVGNGLGTTIAKGLAEAMGGTIGFESTEGAGSRFWVQLPFQPVAAPAAARPTAGPAEEPVARAENIIEFSNPFLRHRARVRPMSVLVADDHAANRMVLQRLLHKAGHRATCVDAAEQVLDSLADEAFDLVIADLHMPGMSGVDMLRQLRLMEAGADARTPVVILSADVTPAAIQACQEAGAWGFLAKPVSTGKLLDTLAQIAEHGRGGARGLRVQPVAEPATQDGAFDPAVLDELAALGMGEAFEREFVGQCLADAEQGIAGIAQAAASSNWTALREHAHAVKGVAGNVGLSRLSSLSGEMMRMPDWQLSGEWRSRVEALRERLSQGREILAVRLSGEAGRDGVGRRGD